MARPEMENCHPLSEIDLKSSIDDETYAALRAHFLAKGKGRRPTIPHLDAPSYRTFAQLHFLREDGGATWETVTTWYRKLFSEAIISRGQLEHKVKMVMTALYLRLNNKEEMLAALNTHVDPNLYEIPQALVDIGLSRSVLLNRRSIDFVLQDNFVLTNEVAYSLELFRCHENETKVFFCEWIRKLFSAGQAQVRYKDSQILYHLGKITKAIKGFQRNKSTDALKDFLSKSFLDACSTPPSVQMKSPISGDSEVMANMKKLEADYRSLARSLCVKEDTIKNLILKAEILREEKQQQEQVAKSVVAEKECLEREIKKGNLKSLKLHRRNCLLQKQIRQQKQDNSSLTKELLMKSTEITDLWRQLRKCDETQKRLELLEERDEHLLSLRKRLKSEQTLKSRYKHDLLKAKALSADLLNKVTENSEKHVQLKVSRTNKYSDNIRLAYMALQGEANVAAENVSKVVQIVAHYLFQTEFSAEDLPSPSSALNFMSEAYVISNQHIAESLLSSKHFTYATDGTSRQKKHYLEKHVQLDNGKTLFLGYNEIPSDDSQTLLEVSVEAFRNLASVTLESSVQPDLDEDSIQKEFIRKLKCLMSDRASVMKCFDEKMAAYKNNLLGEETSTHFLFCNAHFLLGLSSAATDAANNLETAVKASGSRLGRDASSKFATFANNAESAVTRAIRTSAEVLGPRGDEKSGCREEWLSFLSSQGKPSFFTSFRSNRFNNLFENATALLKHQEDIEVFLTDFSSNSNLKLDSVLLDIKDNRILGFVAALAFFNEMFTGPYWSLMKSSTPYGHFPKYVRQMEKTFMLWISDDFDVFSSSPVFEDFASHHAFIIHHFRAGSYDMSEVKTFIQQISQYCFTVFKRQLKDFLDGGIFGGKIDEEVQLVLDSCPLTNLTGERLFGDLDFDMYKRRNATLHLRSSVTMWKRNKTSSYVRSQSDRMRQRLVAKAIRLAPKWRRKSREEHQAVIEKIKRRLVENKRRKDEKVVKSSEKKISIIDSLISHGGVCKTKEDLDSLMQRPNPLESLRSQIRYWKFCCGEKVQVTGNTQTLYSRLVQLIEQKF